MKLTGKCKEEFEKWLGSQTTTTGVYIHRWYVTWAKFNILSNSAKYGVYVDFFDSVGINSSSFSHYEFYKCNLDNTLFNTRPEARLLAIEKANEIYNNAH